MKTILVISDNSQAAEHAARFALLIAQTVQTNILIANICAEISQADHKILAGNGSEKTLIKEPVSSIMEQLELGNGAYEGFWPVSKETSSDHDEQQLIAFINQDHILMIVKGMCTDQIGGKPVLNLNTILNRVQCLLLLVSRNRGR